MLTHHLEPWSLRLHEQLGFTHEAQVVRLPAPPGTAAMGHLVGSDGTRLPWQRSQQDPSQAFVFLAAGLEPETTLTLQPGSDATVPALVRRDGEVLGNQHFRLRLGPVGVSEAAVHPGPIVGIAVADGPWRGACHLDVRADSCRSVRDVLEDGPLRQVVRWSADLGRGRRYACTITLDAAAMFAVLDEDFSTDPDDQIVWDFAGADLPKAIWMLNDSAHHATLRPDLTCDHRLGRVWCWTQYGQLVDRRDGIGAAFADDTVISMVALRGGDWRGGRLNHLEAWIRRWWQNDPRTRRGWPSSAKEDATFADAIPMRGVGQCAPRFNFEGWIGQGRRVCALVVAPAKQLEPLDRSVAVHGPWEATPDVARWSAQLGGLRRIHTRFGLFSLQDQLAMVLAWPHESSALPVSNHLDMRHGPDHDLLAVRQYLDARLQGMWYGSAAQGVNAVTARGVPGAMATWSARIAAGEVDQRTAEALRARFAALAYLNAGNHLYPGDVTMLPLDDRNGSEPSLDGMANQNFLTDVLVIVGMMAETHHDHPRSAVWRAQANRLWARQLKFHTYPNSGLWEESHTYFMHVSATVYPWLAARVHHGDQQAFADDNLRRFLGSVVDLMAPADARIPAQVVMPFGDHGPEAMRWRQVLSEFAHALKTIDPVLAARLTWCHRVSGGTDPEVVPAAAAPERSAVIEGFGVVLRSGANHACAMRSGGAWAHHHQDDGSLQVWGCGRQLIADAGTGSDGTPGNRKFPAGGHSRWLPRDYSPVNILQRHNRGWLVAHDVSAPRPWALAWCPTRWVMIPKGDQFINPCLHKLHLTEPLRHQRLLVQVAPQALLVIDRSEGVEPALTRWHVCGVPVIEAGAARLGLGKDSALWVMPLLGTVATIGQRDVPKDPELATTQVDIDLGNAPLAATLLTWGPAQRPTITPERIGHADWEVGIALTPQSVRIGTTTITWPQWED